MRADRKIEGRRDVYDQHFGWAPITKAAGTSDYRKSPRTNQLCVSRSLLDDSHRRRRSLAADDQYEQIVATLEITRWNLNRRVVGFALPVEQSNTHLIETIE